MELLKETAATATRVEANTPPQTTAQINRETEVRLARAAVDRESLERRLCELNEEWDIERALQTNFAVVGVTGITLGALVARPWFLLTGIAAFFMGQHALQGWCPPMPILRRLGFRTAREIAQERYAVKALRGDLAGMQGQPQRAFQAAAAH